MERVAGTHQRGSYGLAIRSHLSVNFAGGAEGRAAIEHAAPRVTCLEGGGVLCPLLAWNNRSLTASNHERSVVAPT
jgi:hypothetical protein